MTYPAKLERGTIPCIMLNDRIQKVKSFYQDSKSDLFITAIIFFVGMASFGLGRLSVLWPKKEPIQILNQEARSTNQGAIKGTANILSSLNSNLLPHNSTASQGRYVASKSGKAYHYPWCQGAQKIKEGNKIWFQTKEDAVKAGYKPAGNCEGL